MKLPDDKFGQLHFLDSTLIKFQNSYPMTHICCEFDKY